MKWWLSGFSQVVQIRAPVSAAEPRFPPTGTSQQTSTSIIRLMDLIRAGAASPGLGAAEMRGAGGQCSPRRARTDPFPSRDDGRRGRRSLCGSWTRGSARTAFIGGAFRDKRDLGIASPGSPTHKPRTFPYNQSHLCPTSHEHPPRPCGLRRPAVLPQHVPEPGLWKGRGRGFCKWI